MRAARFIVDDNKPFVRHYRGCNLVVWESEHGWGYSVEYNRGSICTIFLCRDRDQAIEYGIQEMLAYTWDGTDESWPDWVDEGLKGVVRERKEVVNR